MHNFKKAVQKFLVPFSEGELNTLKLHLLDHFLNELKRFGTIQFLRDSPYEYFNFIVKQAYVSTSKCLQTRTKDNVTVLDTNLKTKKVRYSTLPETPFSSTLRIKVLDRSGSTIISTLSWHLWETKKTIFL